MVTPSFVIVGAPHFLSMTTLRPLGPSVTLTALASALTPRSSDLRAESSNSNCLAMVFLWLGWWCGSRDVRADPGETRRTPARPQRGSPGCVHGIRLGQPTIARTSRAERMRYSSPPYLTSVPPYLL